MPNKSKSTQIGLSDEAIRHRAYLMWEADGRPDGMAEHYWMKASEITEEPTPPIAKAKIAKAEKSPKAAKAAKPEVTKSKVKTAAAKLAAPAVKAKAAAKTPVKAAARKPAKKA